MSDCARHIMRLTRRPTDAVTDGRAIRCILPGHGPDRSPSASWHRSRTGAVRYVDWHRGGDRRGYTPADIYAAIMTGRDVARLRPPSALTWWLRLLIDAGHLRPADVPMPPVPDDAPPAVAQLCDGFRRLLAAKWIYRYGEPTMFAVRWAAGWCRLPHSTAHDAIRWAVGHGLIHVARWLVRVPLYLPGPAPDDPTGGGRIL